MPSLKRTFHSFAHGLELRPAAQKPGHLAVAENVLYDTGVLARRGGFSRVPGLDTTANATGLVPFPGTPGTPMLAFLPDGPNQLGLWMDLGSGFARAKDLDGANVVLAVSDSTLPVTTALAVVVSDAIGVPLPVLYVSNGRDPLFNLAYVDEATAHLLDLPPSARGWYATPATAYVPDGKPDPYLASLPEGTAIGLHNNHLVIATRPTSAAAGRVYFGDQGLPARFRAGGFYEIGLDGNEGFGALASAGSWLYAFTPGAVWGMHGDHPMDRPGPPVLLFRQYGCAAPRSAATAGATVLYLSAAGHVVRLEGTGATVISGPIEPLLQRHGPAARARAVAAYLPAARQYWLGLPSPAALHPDTFYVFDEAAQAWTVCPGLPTSALACGPDGRTLWRASGVPGQGRVFRHDGALGDDATASSPGNPIRVRLRTPNVLPPASPRTRLRAATPIVDRAAPATLYVSALLDGRASAVTAFANTLAAEDDAATPRDFTVLRYRGGAFADITANLTDANAATTADVNLLGTGDFLYIGHRHAFRGVSLLFGASAYNTNTSALSAALWDGSDWAAAPDFTDGTKRGAATLAGSGTLTWSLPRRWEPTSVWGVSRYWARLAVSATLDMNVAIHSARLHGLAVPFALDADAGADARWSATNRAWGAAGTVWREARVAPRRALPLPGAAARAAAIELECVTPEPVRFAGIETATARAPGGHR